MPARAVRDRVPYSTDIAAPLGAESVTGTDTDPRLSRTLTSPTETVGADTDEGAAAVADDAKTAAITVAPTPTGTMNEADMANH